MAFSIVPLAVIFVIVLIVVAAVMAVRSQKSNEEGNGEEMVFRNLYVYLVLFATLMMSIGGSVAAFMAIADIVAPHTYYQSFESYRMDQKRIYENSKDEVGPAPTEEEIRANYDRLVADEKARTQERAINSLIKSLGWIIIPLPVFFYYQRRLRKA